jgi:hypothetical protein
MIVAIQSEIRLYIYDTDERVILHTYLFDSFREWCLSTGQSFKDFVLKQVTNLCFDFKVDKLIHHSEAEIRLAGGTMA